MTAAAPGRRIRVLVVDDSLVQRELLVQLLTADPAIDVIGTAANGMEAVDAVRRLSPDVVTMDYHMPRLNGMQATRRIMEEHPVPIVIVSGSSAPGEAVAAFRLLEAGAVAVVEKPPGYGNADHEQAAARLVQTTKLMAEVKVVRRWPMGTRAPSSPAARRHPTQDRLRGIAIGASTGGPVVLKEVLERLPRTAGVPILVVQHIAAGFTQGLADWLAQAIGFPVHVARDGDVPLAGHVYLAGEGHHLEVAPDGCLSLANCVPRNGHCPSVSCLFESALRAWGGQGVGVLLTGMGRDGARELAQMREAGAITIVQDAASSVVHGMAGEAIRLGGAAHVLPPGEIGDLLASLVA